MSAPAPSVAKVVRHPLRVRILHLLARSESRWSPSELVDALAPAPAEIEAGVKGPTLGTIAYHVRALFEAGAIRPKGTRMVRGAIEHYYVLDADAAPDLVTELHELEKLVRRARMALEVTR